MSPHPRPSPGRPGEGRVAVFDGARVNSRHFSGSVQTSRRRTHSDVFEIQLRFNASGLSSACIGWHGGVHRWTVKAQALQLSKWIKLGGKVKKIASNILFGSRLGFTVEILGEFTNGPDVRLLCSGRESLKLEVLMETDEDRRVGMDVFGHDAEFLGAKPNSVVTEACHQESRNGTKEPEWFSLQEPPNIRLKPPVVESPTAAPAAYLNKPLHRSGGSAASTFRNFTCRHSMSGAVLAATMEATHQGILYVD